jgi:formyl-CoA transferase
MSTAEIFDGLTAVKVPVGPINDVAQALGSDQAEARETVVSMDPAQANQVQLLANPLKLSATPVTYRIAPPHFGQDTDEIVKWLDDTDNKGD